MTERLEQHTGEPSLKVNGILKLFSEINEGDLIEFSKFRDRVLFSNQKFVRVIGEYQSKLDLIYIEQASYTFNGIVKRLHLSYHSPESNEGREFKKIMDGKK